MSSTPLHVVFGAGQIGNLVVDRLLARGLRVRQVRRGPGGPARPGLSFLSGDLSDLRFAEEAARGASVVYHCVNAPYDQWPALLPGLTRGVIHGAAKAGARLVVLDNLYMYGRGGDRSFTEDTPFNPCSKKGELRAQLAEELFDAHRRGDVQVTTGRASDFFGPGATFATIFGDRFYRRVLAGQAGEVIGNPDLLHSYTYTPDVADGLVTLGTRDEAVGQVFHLPVAPAVTNREAISQMMRALGATPKLTRLPDLAFKVMGLFSSIMREVSEMTYQWQFPFVLDDTRFRRTFGVSATPLEVSMPATAEWARAQYGAARKAA